MSNSPFIILSSFFRVTVFSMIILFSIKLYFAILPVATSFSLLNIENNFLSEIIEKPDIEFIRNHSRKKYVSMNIFSFKGIEIYKYLRDCPINTKRGEKEIVTAIQNMILENKKSVIAFPLCEHVPDLTYKDDLEKISKFLD